MKRDLGARVQPWQGTKPNPLSLLHAGARVASPNSHVGQQRDNNPRV